MGATLASDGSCALALFYIFTKKYSHSHASFYTFVVYIGRKRFKKLETDMKKKVLFIVASIAVGSLMMQSCSSTDMVEKEEPKQLVNMTSERQPIQLTQAQRVFVVDNNSFTLKFLKTVNEADQTGKSFVYSPLSITYVLGMVNDGAVGKTKQELEQTLGFHQGGIQAVNDFCKKLIEGLPKVDKEVELDIANAIFLNQKYTLKEQFQKDMLEYYGAKAEALDFSSNSTLDYINGWCNDKTKGMIPKILDDLNGDMVSCLLNAIYFKADWTAKFDPQNTRNESFDTGNGSAEVPMMHQDVLISYMKNETYAAVKIPYGNGMWNMTVMLPEGGKTTDDVINYLASSDYNFCGTASAGVEPNMFMYYEVDLKIPRYETSSDTQSGLIGLLKKMGINLAFDTDFAEIPNMADVPVYISMMRQKAKIKVSEEGSEAAAVTVAGVNMTTSVEASVEIPKATFHANRPFVYVISEASSDVILFVGKFTGK